MGRGSKSQNSPGAKAARRAFVLQGRFRRFFSNLGPGLITGAADDDPSGISTYSVTGAAFGYTPLWTALFSFPLMAAVQIMCARLGMVTGLGLAGVIRVRYPRWILWGACALLVIANIVNIAADLGGMADVTELLTGVSSLYWTPAYALLLVCLLFWTSYRIIARIFKWLTLALFAYIAAAFLAHPDWPAVLRATLIPRVEWSGAYWATLVGILGTTISPYLFFWQAAQEVEQEIALGRSTVEQREGASKREIRRSRNDVLTGMFFSNLVMYFIILTSAATLHAHGKTTISTRARCRRGAASFGRRWRVLALQPGFDRSRHARSPGIGRILRLRHRGSGRLGWLAGGTPSPRSRLLCGHRRRDGARPRLGLRGSGRRQDALLGSGAQRSTGATPAHPGGAAHQQGRRDGRAPERDPASLAWVDVCRCHADCDCHYVRDGICGMM